MSSLPYGCFVATHSLSDAHDFFNQHQWLIQFVASSALSCWSPAATATPSPSPTQTFTPGGACLIALNNTPEICVGAGDKTIKFKIINNDTINVTITTVVVTWDIGGAQIE